jgi:hypothetical protein
VLPKKKEEAKVEHVWETIRQPDFAGLKDVIW